MQWVTTVNLTRRQSDHSCSTLPRTITSASAEHCQHSASVSSHIIIVIITITVITPLPSSRHYVSRDDCLEDKREDYQNCSVLHCVSQLFTVISTHTWAVLTGVPYRDCWFRFQHLVYGFKVFVCFFLPWAGCFVLCCWCILSSLFSVVRTSASNCLEKLVSKMTCYVSSSLNATITW